MKLKEILEQAKKTGGEKPGKAIGLKGVNPALFPLGRIVLSAGVYERAVEDERFRDFIVRSLGRHARGDWGDVPREDWEANNLALIEGRMLFSVYTEKDLPKIYIITEGDRSATTILFPEEY